MPDATRDPNFPITTAPDAPAAAAITSAGVEQLPSWDLSDLYPGPDSPAVATDLDKAEAEAKAFAAKVKGRLASLSGADLAAAIEEYQGIEETLGKVMSYAQLLFAEDATSAEIGKFYQGCNERVTTISSHLIFFSLELNRIEDKVLEAKLSAAALARFRPWLRDLRVFRPHQLADELERLLHEKEVTGRSAWSRLFDETMAGLRITIDGEELTLSHALNRLSDHDRSRREAAAKAIGATLAGNARLFALITNTLAKDKEIIDTWRSYGKPESFRNRSNMVEDEVVEALVSAVTASFPRLSHRYYALKARWLGLPKLEYWDRNAPLPEDDDTLISWPDAVARVRSAYRGFSGELADVGDKFFTGPWIDARLKPGKASGAFAHPTVPSAHPYLLLNYHGRARDVMTLAHELGHGVHQVLAAPNGYLMSGTPLTLAETASVFGEMLTFRAMLDGETDARRRRVLLAGKVEDMLNTVVRQIAFYRFEQRVHAERRNGEVTPDALAAIWMEMQTESLGPAFTFAHDYRMYWAYIPHFIHTPFYVYAYAFGDCLVNALYGVFRDGHPRFQEKYLDLLRAGGTKRHKELLAPFGLDASDPAFWNKGLDVISGFIDELEAAMPSQS
ncbi:M3 family oligoendopeptidase [Elioraea sp.]|uniref:M3 family oligoendopeptidase n=1 Tax=Elioraea sp. TaxID=2185103 RepID=UPI0038D04F04